MEQTRSSEGNHRRCQLSIKRTFPFLFVIGLISILAGAQEKQLRKPDVIYEPSPQTVVERMLVLANVNNYDIVYDLGCGDGRIVITAAKIFRATGVGIDIDPVRIQESLQNAEKAGVTDRVSFRNEDFFEADIREATVVTLFLSPRANMKLRPKLLEELKPGTRVVSYYWDMGDWEPDKQIEVDGEPIYMWTIPEKRSEGRDLKGKDPLHKGKADELFSKKQREDLAGEQFPDKIVMEARDFMKIIIRSYASLGDQKMDVGMEIKAISEGLDNRNNSRHQLSARDSLELYQESLNPSQLEASLLFKCVIKN